MSKISIIMPVYNSSQFLSQTIDSVLAQSFKDYEFIIVNDGSTDTSLLLLGEYAEKDHRIKIINQKNCGVANARNTGLKNATSPYLAFIDADDLWTENKLEKQVTFFDNPINSSFGLTFTYANCFWKTPSDAKPMQHFIFSTDLYESLLIYNSIPTSSVMVRAALIEKVGDFDENLFGTEDWDLWIRISKVTKIKPLTERLIYYREGDHGISKNYERQFSHRYLVIKKYLCDRSNSNKLKRLALWIFWKEKAHCQFVKKHYLHAFVSAIKMFFSNPFSLLNLNIFIKRLALNKSSTQHNNDNNVTKKNLIFILPTLKCGGAERIICNILKHINKDLFDIKLILIKNTGDLWNEIPNDIQIDFLLKPEQKISNSLFPLVKKLLSICKPKDTIVGSMELDATYFALLPKLFLGCNAIGWVHTNLNEYLKTVSKLHLILVKLFYPFLDKIIAVSEGASISVRSIIGESPNTIVIRNCIDTDRIDELSKMDNSCIPPKNTPVICFVGRLIELKRIDLLLNALTNTKLQSINTQLWIIGDGPEKIRLQSLSSKLNVSEQTLFLGYQSNPYPYIRHADALVLTSRLEGLPTVIIEALALGVPVISTDCQHGPREILDDGKFGLLIDIDNVNQLADSIYTVLSDKDLAMNFRRLGPERAKLYSPSVIIPEIQKNLINL